LIWSWSRRLQSGGFRADPDRKMIERLRHQLRGTNCQSSTLIS
jgi:hypothetical protein